MKFLLSVCSLLCLFLVSCGDDQGCIMTGINVVPKNVTADHTAAPPANAVHFFASGVYHGSCAVAAVMLSPNWSVSDPANVTISNDPLTLGKATCVNHTSGQVTVTATLPPGPGHDKTFVADTKLMCN